jgi:hypothetical protein
MAEPNGPETNMSYRKGARVFERKDRFAKYKWLIIIVLIVVGILFALAILR